MKIAFPKYAVRLLRAVFLRDRSLMTKLLVFSALLVVLPMLLVGLISYHQSSQVLEREARQYSWLMIEQVKHYVEDYLRDFEISTLKILNHPDTVAFLRMKTQEEVDDPHIVRAVSNVLKNSAYSRSDITNITLILDGLQTIDSADTTDRSSARELQQEDWYGRVPPTGQPRIVSRVIHWKGRDEPVISIMKRIVNPTTLKPFGMLVIDVNYRRLQEVARKVKPGESGYLFILDEQGHYVYHPDLSLVGVEANKDDAHVMQQTSSGSAMSSAGGHDMLTFSRSERLNWQLATSIPYDELMRGTDYIGRTILITTTIFVGVAYVLGIGFSTSLMRPIKRLQHYMKRVEVGDFTGKVEVDSMDEIGMLSHGFNKMVTRLSALLEEIYFSKLKQTEMNLRQKETELRMLQAQINPHFLYNSLDTIRGMALQHDMDEIAKMAAALARLLRYNVKEEGARVTVQQEIDVGETYLRIQKYRFEDKLDYRFEMPEWALRQRTARFTLQPLIENCIVHGLEPHSGRMAVKISAERENDTHWVLLIQDSGPGIPPERLAMLVRKLQQGEDEVEAGVVDEGGGVGHIGIMNVHRRIRYTFGEPCGLFLESVPGGGTAVGIRLPYQP